MKSSNSFHDFSRDSSSFALLDQFESHMASLHSVSDTGFTFHALRTAMLRPSSGRDKYVHQSVSFYPFGVPLGARLEQLHAQVLQPADSRSNEYAGDLRRCG